jgi:hypothetical protein
LLKNAAYYEEWLQMNCSIRDVDLLNISVLASVIHKYRRGRRFLLVHNLHSGSKCFEA